MRKRRYAAIAFSLGFGVITSQLTAQKLPEVKSESMDPVLRATPLDPDRIGPPDDKPRENLAPDDQQKDGIVRIFEHRTPVDYEHSIILNLPKKFRYGSSKGVSEGWGTNILTYYPSFTSPSEPENAPFGLACAGYCNGRILISLENKFSVVPEKALSWADLMVSMAVETYHDHQPGNVDVVDEEPQLDSITFSNGQSTRLPIRKVSL